MQEEFTDTRTRFDELNIPLYPSTLPELYFTGDSWNRRSLELIREAEKYILINVFLGNYHTSTKEVWDLLKTRMDEGVDVYLIIDSTSHFQVDPVTGEVVPAAFSYLDELGIPYVEYNPLTLGGLAFPLKQFDRDHRKYWIIDGRTVAAGGLNINYTSLGIPEGIGHIDTMAVIDSPGVARHLTASFTDTWNAYSPERLALSQFPEAKGHDGEQQTSLRLIDHHPDSAPQVTDLFDTMFLSAREEIWMIQGFAFLTSSLIDRVAYAVNRGVEVNIMLSDFAWKENYEMASFYGIRDLLDAGARVYLYRSPDNAFLHYKLMMADRKLTSLGSVNYNFRSQALSREIALVFDDVRVGKMAMDNIESLLEHSRLVTREEAQEYRTPKGLMYLLIMQFWG